MYSNVIHPSYFYRVGLYIRLSQEDKDKKYESESESIVNQRSLLMKYVNECGFTLVDEYVDDGFTGTNFDRPGFQKLLEDIENGKINCVITKDLSRLGRDYIKCGYYVEQYFPQKKVRYISILDQVDTFSESANNDIAPFKALFNDMTSKDTSKKIRSILRDKKEKGKFIGSQPCYGYMRDPEDKGHLIPDPNVCDFVKKIFYWYAHGVGLSAICDKLDSLNAPPPSVYKGHNNPRWKLAEKKGWTISSVNKILKNRMYTGDMVQNIQSKLSYKSQKKIALDKSLWIVVENTHEPLVDKKTFMTIQNSPNRIRKTTTGRDKRLLENLLYCKECGNTLTVVYRKNHDYWSVNCNRYARDPRRGFCSPHFFPYDYLEEQILKKVRTTFKHYISMIDMNKITDEVLRLSTYQKSEENDEDKLKNEISYYEKIIDNLYNDKVEGIVSKDTYVRKQTEYENKIKEIKKQLDKIGYKKIEKESFSKQIPVYYEKIKELINIDKPSRELLIALIEKIIIDNDRNIEIKYKFNIIEPTKFTYKKM